MLNIKKTITYILHVLIILVIALLVSLVIYYIFDLKFSILLLILGLITLAMGYLEFINNHRGIQMPISLGRSPVNSNTTAVLNTDVLMDEREANLNLDKRTVKRKAELIISLFSHTALEYVVAGSIIVICAFSIYTSTSLDHGMTDAMGDSNGFAIEQFPWQMSIDRFYDETGYSEQDTILKEEGMKEVKREGMYPLFYSNVQLDLISRFENEKLSEVGYILITKQLDGILTVSNQLYKSLEKRLPEPVDGSLDMLLELPKTNNVSKSVTWQAIDGSRLTVSVVKIRPNYILEVIASAPK